MHKIKQWHELLVREYIKLYNMIVAFYVIYKEKKDKAFMRRTLKLSN